jgi:hypothetical protein
MLGGGAKEGARHVPEARERNRRDRHRDIGKNSFHVVGHDERGAIVLRQKWSRGQVEARFANMPPCLTRKTLEFKRTALGKFQACAGDEIGDHPRDQNFVRAGLRHHPGGGVNGYTADIPASQLDLAGVEARAQRQTDLLGGPAE